MQKKNKPKYKISSRSPIIHSFTVFVILLSLVQVANCQRDNLLECCWCWWSIVEKNDPWKALKTVHHQFRIIFLQKTTTKTKIKPTKSLIIQLVKIFLFFSGWPKSPRYTIRFKFLNIFCLFVWQIPIAFHFISRQKKERRKIHLKGWCFFLFSLESPDLDWFFSLKVSIDFVVVVVVIDDHFNCLQGV